MKLGKDEVGKRERDEGEYLKETQREREIGVRRVGERDRTKGERGINFWHKSSFFKFYCHPQKFIQVTLFDTSGFKSLLKYHFTVRKFCQKSCQAPFNDRRSVTLKSAVFEETRDVHAVWGRHLAAEQHLQHPHRTPAWRHGEDGQHLQQSQLGDRER